MFLPSVYDNLLYVFYVHITLKLLLLCVLANFIHLSLLFYILTEDGDCIVTETFVKVLARVYNYWTLLIVYRNISSNTNDCFTILFGIMYITLVWLHLLCLICHTSFSLINVMIQYSTTHINSKSITTQQHQINTHCNSFKYMTNCSQTNQSH